MSSSYIDQIDAQIAALRHEIERLQIARDVIGTLEGRGKPVLTLKAETSPSRKSGPITIRKIGDGAPGKKRATTQRQVPAVPIDEVTRRLREGLKNFPDGVRAADLAKHIGMPSDEEQKRIWYVLANLKKSGEAKKVDGLYSLVANDVEVPPDADIA